MMVRGAPTQPLSSHPSYTASPCLPTWPAEWFVMSIARSSELAAVASPWHLGLGIIIEHNTYLAPLSRRRQELA